MYAKKVHLLNYGPIESLQLELPFEGETPKPIVLVGENGSGKSILLSHIVNGLIMAKNLAFPETPEVETDRVYKLRSSSYIKQASDYYFSRVDFEREFFVSELRTMLNREDYPSIPPELADSPAASVWQQMDSKENDSLTSSILTGVTTKQSIDEIFRKNCVLFFPFNRYEEPAWLNEENLTHQALHMDTKRLVGYTNRKVIASSPLRDNQDWLFNVLFDQVAFEVSTINLNLPNTGGQTVPAFPVFQGYSGSAGTYNTALEILRAFTRKSDARFGIGGRNERKLSIHSGSEQLVPSIFQLSSGETSLLNLFLSILRDFDLAGTSFSNAGDIRGIAVVDEIDLHLHAVHQHEVLPNLIRMFPKVQFIITTHSPLFVLGMQSVFGEDGFALHRLPQGRQISPEEFSEFGDAYQAFASTHTFNDDMRAVIEEAQKTIVFIEGITDQKYIERASRVLGKKAVLESLELRDGGGKGKLAKIWKDSVLPLTEVLPQHVLLLFDCDTDKPAESKGKLLQRSIPLQDQHLIKRGIENLFSKLTLEAARQHNPAFFSTEDEHGGTDENGQPVIIHEIWTVNDSEKGNLCEWICKNGTREDFEHFQVVFDIIEEVLEPTMPTIVGAESDTSQ